MLMNKARHISAWLAMVLVLLLTFTLAACGTNASSTGSTSTGNTPTPTHTPAPAPTHLSQTSSTGCPNNATVATQPSAANVVLKNAGLNNETTVKKGETVEVELAFGQNWSLLRGAGNLLEMQNPSGYASPSAHVCVWRFVATNAGTTTLSFAGRPICKPNQLCPQYIMAVSFTITIQ